MAILFLGLRWLRWLIFDALYLCRIRLSPLTAPCLAVSSALSFLSFPFTLFFMTCSALFAWSVLSLPRVSLLGIFLWCSSFSVALRLSLCLRAMRAYLARTSSLASRPCVLALSLYLLVRSLRTLLVSFFAMSFLVLTCPPPLLLLLVLLPPLLLLLRRGLIV